MNNLKLKEKSLTELLELRKACSFVCEDYAKKLTNYATMSADPMFQKMDADTRLSYANRGKFVALLDSVNKIIESKLMELYSD